MQADQGARLRRSSKSKQHLEQAKELDGSLNDRMMGERMI